MKVEGQAILLNVESIEISLPFYRALGFQTVETWEETSGTLGWVRLDQGSTRLMLNRTSRSQSELRRARPDYSDFVGYLYIDSAPDAARELSHQGLPARHVGPQDYGLDEVWIRDPDGYHWVLASHT
ncbi:MAG: VOC family protein [Myxococcota bacterium]